LTKRLNAAHHRWQQSILGISWMDRVTNEEVRARTGQHCMDDILSKKTTLAWACDTHGPTAHTSTGGEVPGFKRGPGRPRPNWRSTVNKDLSMMGLTWQEAEVAALNRPEWRLSEAQCIHFDAGCIKVKVKGWSVVRGI